MRLFFHKAVPGAPTLPVLHSETLVLRCFDLNDAVDVYNAAKNETAALLEGWTPHQSLEESRAWIETIQAEGCTWAIVEKKTGRLTGAISLSADAMRKVEKAKTMRITLGEENWGRGIALEACRVVMRYAFAELDCPVLSMTHLTQNSNSRRVAKKLGFVYEGTLRLAQPLGENGWGDWMLYSMTQQEFLALEAK